MPAHSVGCLTGEEGTLSVGESTAFKPPLCLGRDVTSALWVVACGYNPEKRLGHRVVRAYVFGTLTDTWGWPMVGYLCQQWQGHL